MNVLLWVIQVLLACLFLFAGGVKLVMPIEALTAGAPILLPGWFLRFIGTAEVLGAVGLILPWMLCIRPTLTPMAAAGLFIIMIGATSITLTTGPASLAVMPLVAGLLASLVAYGRWNTRRTRSI